MHNTLTLITAKPVVYLVNLSQNDYVNKKNKWLAKIKQWVDERGDGFASSLIPLSCDLELKLTTMTSQADKDEYLKGLGVPSALPKIIVTGYKTLQLVYYFTAGPDEVRAWTIRVSFFVLFFSHAPLLPHTFIPFYRLAPKPPRLLG